MFGLVGNVVRRRLGSLRSISSLRVTEVFSSVQGEGPFVGRPSVFLRLGMCNLECVWCDTKFTVSLTAEMEKGERMNRPLRKICSSGEGERRGQQHETDRRFRLCCSGCLMKDS